MTTARVFILLLTLSSLVTQQSHAEGTAEEGKLLAQEHCMRCHIVDPGGPFKKHPPSFFAISVYRSEDQIRGRIIFPPTHSSMPQMAYFLTPDNVDHLVAYILSLEKK